MQLGGVNGSAAAAFDDKDPAILQAAHRIFGHKHATLVSLLTGP